MAQGSDELAPAGAVATVGGLPQLDVFVTEPEAWIARAEAAGATRLWRSEDPDDWFQVLGDPEGNELCICLMPTA